MSSLSPQRPLLIVVIGQPGAGKSFFARQFAETFSSPLISFDEIRSGLFDSPAYSNDEDFIVAHVAGLQLRELLKTKRTIIIDGGHNPRVSRDELARAAKTAGYGVLIVWVQADERIARSRALKRRSNRPDDAFNRSLTIDEFETHSRRFTAPGDRESFVVISGHHTYATQVRSVLKRLANQHEPAKTTLPQRPAASQSGRRPVTIN